ncbi:lipocalin-like domain-containing protein [Streptomyces sp. NPDC102364]|uniref:lipocalin-like domain-containing protein n=1 Tax=Streptomyces sp. NPDC102364 TaxID=3366161 RepID=UPI00381EBFD9
MRADDLIGAWRLVSFEELDDDTGATSEGPLGAGPCGRLIYTRDGHVSVNMMRGADPGPVPYMGYAGTWRLDGSRVVHRIEVTARPDWVGTEQSRKATLEDGRLTLWAETHIEGVRHRRVLVWRRDGT